MAKKQLDSDIDVLEESDKIHPWRICPIGKHYVRTHNLHIHPSKEHPTGQIVIRHAHCADNPSHKDMLSYDEIQIISKTHFSALGGPPKAGVLKEFPNADNFDELIRGWVHYWNEIFHAKDTLNPNLVKALIASESSFDSKKSRATKSKKLGYARGLMQIIDGTLTIIGDHGGELKDHFICLTHAEVMDPSANICTGVRWLFMKKAAAAERLDHKATWDDAVAEYKGILKDIIENKDSKHNPDPYNEMPIFRSFYDRLRGS